MLKMKKLLGLLLSMVLALSCMSVDVKAFSTGSNLIKLQFKEVGGINDNKPLPFTEGGVFNDGGSKWYPREGSYQTKKLW